MCSYVDTMRSNMEMYGILDIFQGPTYTVNTIHFYKSAVTKYQGTLLLVGFKIMSHFRNYGQYPSMFFTDKMMLASQFCYIMFGVKKLDLVFYSNIL